jgi:hypothetical protein
MYHGLAFYFAFVFGKVIRIASWNFSRLGCHFDRQNGAGQKLPIS